MNEQGWKALADFLDESEHDAAEAKARWDELSMNPNDRCGEVLKLVKIIRLMEDESELGFMGSTWDKISEILK